MIEQLLNKSSIIIFIMSILNVCRHIFYIIQLSMIGNGKYKLNNIQLYTLAFSIAFVIMFIITS